jgi:hypothetical protein
LGIGDQSRPIVAVGIGVPGAIAIGRVGVVSPCGGRVTVVDGWWATAGDWSVGDVVTGWGWSQNGAAVGDIEATVRSKRTVRDSLSGSHRLALVHGLAIRLAVVVGIGLHAAAKEQQGCQGQQSGE